MVYFVLALALFADDGYEEVIVKLTETLREWGCWDMSSTALLNLHPRLTGFATIMS